MSFKQAGVAAESMFCCASITNWLLLSSLVPWSSSLLLSLVPQN